MWNGFIIMDTAPTYPAEDTITDMGLISRGMAITMDMAPMSRATGIIMGRERMEDPVSSTDTAAMHPATGTITAREIIIRGAAFITATVDGTLNQSKKGPQGVFFSGHKQEGMLNKKDKKGNV